MNAAPWVARAWLPYTLAGIAWVLVGALVLGTRGGIGLVFIGLDCLAIGLFGALWRGRHGYGLFRGHRLGRR
jgi:hypothetical protein